MEIKTKFKIGNPVWIIYNNKPIRLDVVNIKIIVKIKGTEIIYGFWADGETQRLESECFATKGELVKFFSQL